MEYLDFDSNEKPTEDNHQSGAPEPSAIRIGWWIEFDELGGSGPSSEIASD